MLGWTRKSSWWISLTWDCTVLEKLDLPYCPICSTFLTHFDTFLTLVWRWNRELKMSPFSLFCILVMLNGGFLKVADNADNLQARNLIQCSLNSHKIGISLKSIFDFWLKVWVQMCFIFKIRKVQMLGGAGTPGVGSTSLSKFNIISSNAFVCIFFVCFSQEFSGLKIYFLPPTVWQ